MPLISMHMFPKEPIAIGTLSLNVFMGAWSFKEAIGQWITSKVITRLFFVVEGLNNIRPYGNPTDVNCVRRPRLFETLEDHVPLCALIGHSKFMPRANSWLLTRGKGHILERERQRERYKTIDLIVEYNHFMWECKHLATFPPSSFETECENLISWVLWRTWTALL